MSYVPETIDESPHLDELTPREIVRELDKYVIGQAGAKRAVAIALRNRIRRQKLPPEMVRNEKLEEVADKADANAEERILDLLLPSTPGPATPGDESARAATEQWNRTREK